MEVDASRLDDRWVLPTLDLLAAPDSDRERNAAATEQSVEMLEDAFQAFGIDVQVAAVRSGPLTMVYEVQLAPGIKTSSVVALADDIARSMSAISARIATVPGRNVLAVELPKKDRESILLSEILGSTAFEMGPTDDLLLVLGKTITGGPALADLATMPHLLVAGTTGSGKSVGLNSMILSLLYRLTPDECRMIMIDPKMLELSIYDDIPHLLAPVVTDPPKAIRALKWAVEQMEDRYRMMASVGVRGLASFNEKVRAAKAKGQPLGRRVQTAYDAETGQPIYEEEKLEFEPLPKIVVVVDELADLMMTAGKEVEFLIQRLAQKARAAGIHLIMATQHPSSEIVTSSIKASLPARIAFRVMNHHASRTIIGESGAEDLLGNGDMLVSLPGEQLLRAHGAWVDESECAAVADHWRRQKLPDYITAITREIDDTDFGSEGAPAGADPPDLVLYRKAIAIVAASQKASTSYVQRELRIGYNAAAMMIDRMEREGLVSAPDHVGRRTVLIDRNGTAVATKEGPRRGWWQRTFGS